MIIELLNGTRFDINDYNLKRLFHYVPSVGIEHNSVPVDKRSDVILTSKINNRVISVEFIYQTEDIFDYYLLRDELNALFLREESYYIIFKNEPYKRYHVKVASGYNIQPNHRMESFVIEFITISPYAESVATTTALKEWDVDMWAWNNSVTWDDDLNYTFNSNEFTVMNLGNYKVDPISSELRIDIRATTTGALAITNNTTGDLYVFNGTLNVSQPLLIDGIRTTLAGIPAFANTNRRLITLASGANNFTVTGGTISSISFDFRFLYL